MLRSKIGTLIILLMGSSSICCATQCPHNAEVTSKIEALATDGKAIIEDQTYHLIGRDETSLFYQEKLLSNDVQLNGFLKVSKLLEPNLPDKAQAQFLPLLPTPNFCTYRISLGENSRVIALSTIPESAS
jgi:hypothetical protein